jgi:uncharacterized protein
MGQQMICGNKELSGLDVALAQAANAAQPKLAPTVEAARQFGEEHLRFRNFLETCLKAPAPSDCIAHNYRVRTTELQIAGGLVTDPPPVSYRCSDQRDVEVRFYTSTATPAVVLTRESAGGGMAFADRSKPGTYVGPEVTLSEGVDGASKIRWRGTELTCRPRSPG